MYSQANLEIAGSCNAKCPWCVTGKINRTGLVNKNKNISFTEFEREVRRLEDLGLIGKETLINLFSWGEPFKNPDIRQIFNFLNAEGYRYVISTNGSLPFNFFEDDSLSNLANIIFSVPGFSQESYDRIHGFKFEKVKNNIKMMLEGMWKAGFMGTATMSYHVYQFNVREIPDAMRWSDDNGIVFFPYFAYFNDYTMYADYLKSKMDGELLRKASQDLFLHYIDDIIKISPSNWMCPQITDLISLDENSNVLICCVVTKEMESYSIGSLYELSKDEIINKKQGQKICDECNALGISYLVHNSPFMDSFIKDYVESFKQNGVFESEIIKLRKDYADSIRQNSILDLEINRLETEKVNLAKKLLKVKNLIKWDKLPNVAKQFLGRMFVE